MYLIHNKKTRFDVLLSSSFRLPLFDYFKLYMIYKGHKRKCKEVYIPSLLYFLAYFWEKIKKSVNNNKKCVFLLKYATRFDKIKMSTEQYNKKKERKRENEKNEKRRRKGNFSIYRKRTY